MPLFGSFTMTTMEVKQQCPQRKQIIGLAMPGPVLGVAMPEVIGVQVLDRDAGGPLPVGGDDGLLGDDLVEVLLDGLPDLLLVPVGVELPPAPEVVRQVTSQDAHSSNPLARFNLATNDFQTPPVLGFIGEDFVFNVLFLQFLLFVVGSKDVPLQGFLLLPFGWIAPEYRDDIATRQGFRHFTQKNPDFHVRSPSQDAHAFFPLNNATSSEGRSSTRRITPHLEHLSMLYVLDHSA
jgi:hypothetical protein